MTGQYTYPAYVEADEDGVYLVTFPDLPEALTDGSDIAEALTMAEDCLAEAIAARINDGEMIPTPSAVETAAYAINCPPQIALKAAIYEAMQAQKLTKVKLAELLGVNEKEARRIVDPHHGTKLSTLVKVLRVLGKQVQVSVLDGPRLAS